MLQIDRLHRGDAFDLIPGIEDGSLDLVVCDGPYGVTANEWDRIGSIQEFNLRLIRIFAAKLKEGAPCTFSASRTVSTSSTIGRS